MCSIGGFVVRGGVAPAGDLLAAAVERMLVEGAARGSDAFGVTVVAPDGSLRTLARHTRPSAGELGALLDGPVTTILTSTRATPTTEWRAERTERDVQPFQGGDWVTTHNGTIGNDRELVAGLRLRPQSGVDSAVLPCLFDSSGFQDGLDAIEGSYAVGALDVRRPRVVHLARNFKPLFVGRHETLPLLGFASSPEQLEGAPDREALDRPRIVALAPYSRATFDGDADRLVLSEPVASHARRRALVIASGGLDSTVAAAGLVHDGVDVSLLHFSYGCRAQAAEIRSLHQIGRALRCPVRVEQLRWLGELGGSTLTSPDGEISVGETGAELPHEWVPARNMLMIAHACAIADAEGFTDIVLGTNLEEGGAYSDNTQEFIDAMDHASQIGTMSRATVSAPLGLLVKHEIVRRGIELDAPLGLTWSCYHSGETPCGQCGPCFMRRVAFDINGIADPIAYDGGPVRRLRPVES